MKTFDENNIERKAQDIRFNSFIYLLRDNDFDKIVQQTIEKNIQEMLKLKSKKINLANDFEIIIEEVLLAERLKALVEMKIVYVYKNFEIALKYFLINIYPDFKVNSAYKINYLISFLKDQKIDFCKILFYEEIDQLRRVNNSIKHSSIEQAENLDNIQEFKGKELIDYNDLLQFYKRMENVNIHFFKDLRIKILSNLKIKTSKLLY